MRVSPLRLGVLLGALLLTGCFGTGTENRSDSRYTLSQDTGPAEAVDLSWVPDAVPRVEPPSRGGNKSPYQVWGKRYQVLDSAQGYRKRGNASWYGKKFHGHLTSNGETYDMYQMSAAHKSLPLPSFARVTNLDNDRSVVVRVNDRGPFHDDRLIDLSYAAAYRLDMLQQGTARVEVEVLHPTVSPARLVEIGAAGQGLAPVTPPLAPTQYLQVGAYGSWGAAQSVKTQLEYLVQDLSVLISKHEGEESLYRVRLGPLAGLDSLDGLFSVLRAAGFPDPQVVDLP